MPGAPLVKLRVRIPPELLADLDALVERGRFASRAEALREAAVLAVWWGRAKARER